MDFWSRLLNNTPLSVGPSRKEIAKDPQRRRFRFEKEYGQLLQTWRNSSNLVRDTSAADTIELRIQELTNILIDESRRPLPHTCLAFSAEKQVYATISKIAATSYNLHIIKEAVYFFGILIESEDDAFVENGIFATSLTNLFVRITGANSIHLDSDTETKVVELAFNVTTKIRLRPEILPAWFKPRQEQQQQQQNEGHQNGGGQEAPRDKESDSHERFKGKTQRRDFPLFYILMDYIHSEGKLGDFARTGLLYIIESASAAASALEQWIVESDLSTLMATGLGALYSQLSRKLVIDHPPNNVPPVLALSDYRHPQPTYEAVSSCSPDFQVQLDTFLSHLLFWQDVLNHCRSAEVKSTLLEHFQVIFLQQLLYPSLLESSDLDGGSSVAVLTYLRRILEALDHPDMINLILHYLLALPDATTDESRAASKNAASAARKRKSMDLASLMAAKPEIAATPTLYNLVDLALACLKSHSQQTIYVTLQLISTILRRHHRYAVTTLLRTAPVTGVASHRTIGAHKQDVEFFMSIASVVGGQDDFDGVFDGILKDTAVRLESHQCSLKLVTPKISRNNHELPAIPDSLPGAPRDVSSHTIRPDDPLFNTILDRLETFFTNPVESNLSITETVLDLATCGYVSLEGWVLRHPDGYVYESDEEDEIASSPISDIDPLENDTNAKELRETAMTQKCRRRPKWTSVPRFVMILEILAEQLVFFRDTIPRFDDLLQQRREAFQTADSPPPPLPVRNKGLVGNVLATPEKPFIEDLRQETPARSSVLENLAQRLISEFSTPPRDHTSRDRKENKFPPGSSTFGSPFGSSGRRSENGNGKSSLMLANQSPSTPTSTRMSSSLPPVPPKEFPLNGGKGGTLHGGNPSVAASEDSRDSLVASQMAAFQAIDREILARRVGLPTGSRSTVNLANSPIHIDSASMGIAEELDGESGPGRQKEKELDHDTENADGPVDSELGLSDDGKSTGEGASKGALKALEEAAEARPPAGLAEAKPASGSGSPDENGSATVSHILTNAIVFQSFVLEVAAVLQVRAGLFDEVRFV